MAQSIDPGAPFPFVLKADRDLPEDATDKTVWTLRALNPRENAKIQDRAGYMEAEEFMIRSGTVQLETLRRGLVGAEKFPDGNGGFLTPVRKTIKGELMVEDDFIARIRLVDRAELADAIGSGGRLDVVAAEKS